MVRISRLKDITKAKIEAFLSYFETPETVLPQLEKELAGNLEQALRAEAKALTAVKADQRRLDAETGRVSRYKEGAVLAVKAGHEDIARQAVAAQIEAEKERERMQKVLEVSENAYKSAKNVRQQLQQNLKELRIDKEAMLERSRQLRVRKSAAQLEEQLQSNTNNILEAVARIQAGVEQAEIYNDVRNEIDRKLGIGFDLERIKELETKAIVDQRLSKIKEQIEKRRGQ